MTRVLVILAAILLAASFALQPAVAQDEETVAGKCMTCHKKKSPGLYQQWYRSNHGAAGVTCIQCHQADPSEPDAYEHEGAYIATLVTPKDCGACHEEEAKQVQNSYHAKAGEILQSKDAYLAHAVGGDPVAIAGCESCHGAKVEIDPERDNKLSRLSWPNSGIGRINPDGSKGACTACHTRHNFDVAQARKPEACSKCHLGPDHPQKEVYEASKHGNVYFTNQDVMNLRSDRWQVGVDYFRAPTCATCHMSATPKQPITHNVGDRISWTLRPIISTTKENWEVKRESMQEVCRNCHGQGFVDGHYAMMDGVINLYNDKFARPAKRLYDLVAELGLRKNVASFSNKYEWTFWELWHHEGRRARHGAAMMGPDYTWWHGIYEVGQHFYFKYIPQLRDLDNAELDAAIDEILAEPFHAWMQRPTEEIKADIASGTLQEKYADLFAGPQTTQ